MTIWLFDYLTCMSHLSHWKPWLPQKPLAVFLQLLFFLFLPSLSSKQCAFSTDQFFCLSKIIHIFALLEFAKKKLQSASFKYLVLNNMTNHEVTLKVKLVTKIFKLVLIKFNYTSAISFCSSSFSLRSFFSLASCSCFFFSSSSSLSLGSWPGCWIINTTYKKYIFYELFICRPNRNYIEGILLLISILCDNYLNFLSLLLLSTKSNL